VLYLPYVAIVAFSMAATLVGPPKAQPDSTPQNLQPGVTIEVVQPVLPGESLQPAINYIQ
jgi:hypothetical protein